MIVGLVMGGYGSLNARARDDDCFSAWYFWGVNCIDFSNYFMQPFIVKEWTRWIGLLLKISIFGVLTYNVPAICIPELQWNKANPWNQNFGFLSRDVKVPIVGAMTTDEIIHILSYVAYETLNILVIYAYLS